MRQRRQQWLDATDKKKLRRLFEYSFPGSKDKERRGGNPTVKALATERCYPEVLELAPNIMHNMQDVGQASTNSNGTTAVKVTTACSEGR